MKTKNLIQTIREKNKFIDHLIEEGLNDVRKIVDLEADQELMLGINVKLKAEVERLKNVIRRVEEDYNIERYSKNALKREYEEYKTGGELWSHKVHLEKLLSLPWYKIPFFKKQIKQFNKSLKA